MQTTDQTTERGLLRTSLLAAIDHNHSAEIIKIYEKNPFIITQIFKIDIDFYLTPLLYAVHKGAAESVQTLFNCNANVNCGCNTGNASTKTKQVTFTLPLHYAIEVGARDEIIDLILNQKPKTYSLNGQHSTALNLAINNNKHEIAEKVLNLGRPTPIDELLTMMKRKYYVDIPASVWSAIGFQKLVKRGRPPHILAHCAAENGHTGILHYLQGKINYDLAKVFVLIHDPCMNGPRIEEKVFHSADDFEKHQKPIEPESKPCSKYGLLHIAAKNNQINIIQLLLQSGCNINETYSEGRTVVAKIGPAVCSDIDKIQVHFPSLRPLRINDLKKFNLHMKKSGHKKASLNTHFEYRKTALEIALKMEHYDVVKFLLQSGSKLKGLTELHDRMENSDFKMANIILDHVDKSLLKNDKILGSPALNYICKCKEDCDIEEVDKLIKTYIHHGYNLNDGMKGSIHAALENANMAVLQIFVNNNADINCTNLNGELPVTIVAGIGDVSAMKLLVSEGVNPFALTEAGISTLHSAIEQNRMEIIEYLLSINVDINMKSKLKLSNRSIENSTREVKTVRTAVNFLDENIEWSPLALAVYHGMEDMVEYLLSKGALLNGLDELILSISCGHVKMAMLLMPSYQESFTDIQYLDNPILNYLNPSVIPDFSNDTRVLLQAFIGRGYNVNAFRWEPSGPNVTLLHTAVLHGGLKMVMFLMEHGADINCLTSDRSSPLHVAVLCGLNHINNFLISQGADVNSCGSHASVFEIMKKYYRIQNTNEELFAVTIYKTPLMLAVVRKHEDIARVLLQHGAKLQGVTELHISIRMRYFSISNLLLDNMTTEMTEDTINGSPALHQLAKNGGKFYRCASLEMEEIKKLIEKYCRRGYDINVVNCKGLTVFHLAIAKYDTNLVKILVQLGVDINLKTPSYNMNSNFSSNILHGLEFFKSSIGTQLSPLLLCLTFCYPISDSEIPKILVENGATLNGVLELHFCLQNYLFQLASAILNHNFNLELKEDTIDGIPTLHQLVITINNFTGFSHSIHVEQVISKYIQAGYNIDRTDTEGFTVLHIASLDTNTFLVKILVENGADINKTCPIYFEKNNSYRIGKKIRFLNPECIWYAIHNNRTELIKCILEKIRISALTIAVLYHNEEMTTCLLQNGAIPNGVAELHILLINRNVKLANNILGFVPSCHSLKEDKIGDIPTLQFVVETQYKICEAEMKTLICEYVRRGYDINSATSEQIPLLHSCLVGPLQKGTELFDFLISINECNIDGLHNGKSALTILISNCKESRDVRTLSGRDNVYCCKYYIKQLIKQFASVDLCDLSNFVYHSGHADVLKLLYFAGVKFPENFRNSIIHSSRLNHFGAQHDDCEKAEFVSFCDWLEKKRYEVKPLQFLSRIAFRRLRCARDIIQSKSIPEKIKSYIKLDEYLDSTY